MLYLHTLSNSITFIPSSRLLSSCCSPHQCFHALIHTFTSIPPPPCYHLQILLHALLHAISSVPFLLQVPKLHTIEDTERYLAVINQFVFVACDCVVTMHGITLSPLALVMEYLPLGPLDVYLRQHNESLKEVSV